MREYGSLPRARQEGLLEEMTPAMASSGEKESVCVRSAFEEDTCCYCTDLETCVGNVKTRDECEEQCGSGFVEFIGTEAACHS